MTCPPQDIGIIFVEKNVNWLSYSSGQRFLMFSTERLGLSSKDAITFLWRMHCPCLSRHIIFPSTKITLTAIIIINSWAVGPGVGFCMGPYGGCSALALLSCSG